MKLVELDVILDGHLLLPYNEVRPVFSSGSSSDSTDSAGSSTISIGARRVVDKEMERATAAKICHHPPSI